MNGKIKFNIGGKERGFLFGIVAIGNILKHFDLKLPQDLMKLTLADPYTVYPFVFLKAAEAHSSKYSEVIDYTLEDMVDWLDDIQGNINSNEIVPLINCYLFSLGIGIPNEPVQPEPEGTKKKLKK